MKIEYKGREFHLTTIVDIEGTTWGIIAIYEMTYKYFKDNGQVIEVSSDEYDKASEEGREVPTMDLRFIDYYWQDTDEEDELIAQAQEVIDNYDKKDGKLVKLLRGLENKIKTFPKGKGISEMLEEDESIEEDLFDIVETMRGE